MKLKTITMNTDKGPYLNINEDNAFYNIKKELFIILDGFGGSGVGDETTNNLVKEIDKFYGTITDDIDATLPFFYSAKYLLETNALLNSILSSAKKLYESNMTKDFARRGGASGILASKCDSILNLVSIGNCRAYLMRESNIVKLFCEESFESLSDSSVELCHKSMPINAFGLYPDLSYQVKEVRISEGDKFLFVTDGVYTKLREEELKNTFSNENKKTQDRILEIFELSNKRGNLDNQTCMLLEF